MHSTYAARGHSTCIFTKKSLSNLVLSIKHSFFFQDCFSRAQSTQERVPHNPLLSHFRLSFYASIEIIAMSLFDSRCCLCLRYVFFRTKAHLKLSSSSSLRLFLHRSNLNNFLLETSQLQVFWSIIIISISIYQQVPT